MRILITNNTLASRAGTELYVRDIALRLRELGHEPVCFTLDVGAVAEELREQGVKVVCSLSQAHGPFDLIHGHHRIETTLAAMAFPKVPVLSICHGPSQMTWQESPAFLPNIIQYAAVDESCRDRLVAAGIPRNKIPLLLNFADTRRFLPRPPLPPRPQTALVFSNYAHEGTHLPAVRRACENLGITMDVAGHSAGRIADRPEELLPKYDLVFAKARAATEAMAVGCAVILCDFFGAGQMVTSEQLDELRPLNFGIQVMGQPVSVGHLTEQILCYDPEDAARVRDRMRTEASLDAFMPELLALYERVASARVPEFDPWEAGAEFLKEQIGYAKDARNRLPAAEKMVENLGISEQALRHEVKVLRDEIQQVYRAHRDAEQIIAVERAKVARLRENKTSLQIKNQELKVKNRDLKNALESLRQKRRSWWKKWISP